MSSITNIRILVILCTIAVVMGRPNAGIGNLMERILNSESKTVKKRSINETEDLLSLTAPSMLINTEDFKNFMECTTCLASECSKVRRSALAYYFCASCIRNCSGNMDALMQFFSTHECNYESPKIYEQSPPEDIPKQVLGGYIFPLHGAQVSSGPNPPVINPRQQGPEYGDNFDRAMNQMYFSNDAEDNCALKNEKYEEMEVRWSRCMTDLHFCKDNQINGQPCNNNNNYEYTYPDYTNSADEEKSNHPTDATTQQSPTTTNNFPQVDSAELNQLQNLYPDLANLIRANPMYMTNVTNRPTNVPPVTSRSTKTQNAQKKVVELFKSRFITKSEFNKLSNARWNTNPGRLAEIKIAGGQKRAPKRAVCPTRFKLVTPGKLVHHSGLFGVELIESEEQKQFFFVGECTFKKPTVTVSREGTFCDEVPNLQKAVFQASKKMIQNPKLNLKNCDRLNDDSGEFYCDDWVRVSGACSLFMDT